MCCVPLRLLDCLGFATPSALTPGFWTVPVVTERRFIVFLVLGWGGIGVGSIADSRNDGGEGIVIASMAVKGASDHDNECHCCHCYLWRTIEMPINIAAESAEGKSENRQGTSKIGIVVINKYVLTTHTHWHNTAWVDHAHQTT